MRLFISTLGVCLLASAQETLTIQQALEMTAKLSPDVQIARLQALESVAKGDAVKCGYLPQASIAVSGTYQTSNLQGIGLAFPGVPERIGPYRTFNARPQVTQTLLDLSLLKRMRAARSREGQAKADARTVREDAEIAVLQLYLQALATESRASAADARLAAAEALLKQTSDREQGGTSSKLDVARAVQQAEAERGALIDARREAATLKTLLWKTIGAEKLVDARLVAPEIRLQAFSDEGMLLKKAVGQRPEVEALQFKERSAREETRAAELQRMPRISGFGDYGVAGAGPDRSLSTYTVGASLTIPLWTGRRIESEVAQAKLQQSQVEQEARRVNLQIQQEIRSARIGLEAAQAAKASAERGREAAIEALDLARMRFEAGLATSVDTQTAQSQLASSDDTRIRAAYDLSLSQARLAKALGELSAAFQ